MSLKTTFWPMIGGIKEGFTNYLAVLRAVERNKWNRSEFLAWLTSEFGLKDTYARNILTTLLFGTGLIDVENGRCVLDEAGQSLLKRPSPDVLYALFAEQFVGIREMVEILGKYQPLDLGTLFDKWHKSVRKTARVKWKTSHAQMQFKHRLDWLRSLSVVRRVADSYYLSKSAMEGLARARSQQARDEEERRSISHNDIEDKLRAIGEFFEFMSIKRASVNDARPRGVPALAERRQLDCLWARVVHFGGRVQYAFEVQLGGNIADAIERLEMVSSFVHKAVVVTDEEQEQRIRDRLDAKHSALRDKIIFLSYEDINTVAEAVNALKVFTQRIFHD